MNNILFIGFPAMALFFTLGCSSLTVVKELHDQRFTSTEQPVAHLSARVGGIYLFYSLPLVTGDSEQADGIRFFRHEPDVERVVLMVTKKSQELGATHLTDLYSWSDSVWGSFSANASMLPRFLRLTPFIRGRIDNVERSRGGCSADHRHHSSRSTHG
jgi:hypothetical protein